MFFAIAPNSAQDPNTIGPSTPLILLLIILRRRTRRVQSILGRWDAKVLLHPMHKKKQKKVQFSQKSDFGLVSNICYKPNEKAIISIEKTNLSYK